MTFQDIMNKIIKLLGGNEYKLGYCIKQTNEYKTKNRTLPFCVNITNAARIWDELKWTFFVKIDEENKTGYKIK